MHLDIKYPALFQEFRDLWFVLTLHSFSRAYFDQWKSNLFLIRIHTLCFLFSVELVRFFYEAVLGFGCA
jgi:hypothetical protein